MWLPYMATVRGCHMWLAYIGTYAYMTDNKQTDLLLLHRCKGHVVHRSVTVTLSNMSKTKTAAVLNNTP